MFAYRTTPAPAEINRPGDDGIFRQNPSFQPDRKDRPFSSGIPA